MKLYKVGDKVKFSFAPGMKATKIMENINFIFLKPTIQAFVPIVKRKS